MNQSGKEDATSVAKATVASKAALPLIAGLFFLSGSAGLVYQVLWMRSLGLFFGSDLYGVTIILSAFMGGLAIGSLAGGQLAERTALPLMWYGIAEGCIAIAALSFPSLLAWLDPVLQTAYPESADEPGALYQLLRVVFAGGTLLIPTALMGATLPLILRYFVRSRSNLGERAALFYATNTFGALAGTLTAGFVLLPQLGAWGATQVAASVNLLIATVCIPVGLRSKRLATQPEPPDKHAPEHDPLAHFDLEQRRRISRAAILAFGISGFGSFALEVVWTRILIISFSATVYSFTSMLSCFLFGIFFGSLLVAETVDRQRDPIRLFAFLELGVAASVAALCLLVNVVPELFGGILNTVLSALGENRDHALVVATLLTSFIFLCIPATLLGATFSVALRTHTLSVARIGRHTGNLYASNTFGAILGSLCGGLVMIPVLGAKASLAILALLFLANSVYLASARHGFGPETLRNWRIAVPAMFVLTVAGLGTMVPYRVTLNFNQKSFARTELLYHAEGVQNTVDVVRSHGGVTSLIIGGNVEADDGYTQKRHFILKGHLPLMLHRDPKSVLVVGLGMGITLGATARHPGLEKIDVIELSPEILAAQEQLGRINGNVVDNPLVRIRIDDGRAFMKRTDHRYDMITADPIHPKISRVGYLYTEEYYRSIRDRLNPGGIVCQWMPLYQISPTRLRSAMKSFVEVFPNTTFWYVKNHGLFIAQRDPGPIDYRRLAGRFESDAVRDDLASIDIQSPEDLLGLLLMGPEQIRSYLDEEPDVPLNTDDYPYLEYFVPSDFFYRVIDNVREFLPHLADPTSLVEHQPKASAAALSQRIVRRPERLLEELAVSQL